MIGAVVDEVLKKLEKPQMRKLRRLMIIQTMILDY